MATKVNARTSIALSRETVKALAQFGKKGDTYEHIIKLLIEHYEQGRGTEAAHRSIS